jgi:hypothetical protein
MIDERAANIKVCRRVVKHTRTRLHFIVAVFTICHRAFLRAVWLEVNLRRLSRRRRRPVRVDCHARVRHGVKLL